ncbi:hypothetical protein NO995_13590 [Aestuariibaculum sp. M13]|uniref:BACON domain-containing protein n=1 Tax=Aestuariibaculum sp. M13 TaxID=2967132 RepID=UPI002159D719|nr:BACON domain-containing carbohydrate-binding protein [Aestuariibaculum sp. M13]MCR8668720.1 hypothetical protein [Aestuariibaculum sp. M13]
MKQQPLFKVFFALSAIISIFLACDSDDDGANEKNRTPYFNIEPIFFSEENILEVAEDSLKVDIKTNSYWEITKGEDAEWLSVSPNKGTGDNVVKLLSKENATIKERTSWVYFTAYQLKDSVKVTQKGRDLILSQAEFKNVSANETLLNFNVEANIEWKAQVKETLTWLSLNKTTGEKGLTALELTVSANEFEEARIDSILFISKDENPSSKVWLKVAQDAFAAPEPSIVIESNTPNVGAEAGEFVLNFMSNIDWVISTEIPDVTFSTPEGTSANESQSVTINYPANTDSESREIMVVLKGKAPNDEYQTNFKIVQSGAVAPGLIVKNTIIDIDGKNQIFTIELTSSNVDWKAVSLDPRFVITDNASGMATTAPILIKVNASDNKTLTTLSGIIEIQKADDASVKTEVTINQGLHPMNDETVVYDDPSKTAAQLSLDQGVAHPTKEGWNFWNAHEFTDNSTGFWNFDTRLAINHAVFNDGMRVLENGTLKLKTKKLAAPTVNKYGDPAEYEMSALYSKRHDQGGVKWVKFTKNMRVEVRYRNSGKQGFNEAIWFMGQSNYDSQKIPWPQCGEIDLVEAPYKNEAHFALHTENFSANTSNAEAASVKIADETKWNIYWVEILEDRIIGGINGHQYFEHVKGDGGNNDWPWDNPSGMMMIITPGIGGWTGTMPNMTVGEEAIMELDWIRVYTNSSFDVSSQTGHDGKFY